MHTKIDWLSFTFKVDNTGCENDKLMAQRAWDALEYELGSLLHLFSGGGEFKPEKGRKPYSISYRTQDGGIAVFFNHKLDHMLVEISGKGCERVFSNEQGQSLLRIVGKRTTRIDIACDMVCETNPLDFVKSRSEGRFKSHSEFVSESGTTAYVGSKSSNRYARVYRYNQPHPRAHLLRAEHVFRGDDAKIVVTQVLNVGLHAISAWCGELFGWLHPSWEIKEASELEIKAHRPERGDAKTVFWLYETVAPVIIRLHKEGILDFADFFREAIAPNLFIDNQGE